MKQTHYLKCHPQYFAAVYNVEKNFEIRKNDRNYQVGDRLLLQEWCPLKEGYTGNECVRQVTYILDDPDYVKDGFVIMSIQ